MLSIFALVVGLLIVALLGLRLRDDLADKREINRLKAQQPQRPALFDPTNSTLCGRGDILDTRRLTAGFRYQVDPAKR